MKKIIMFIMMIVFTFVLVGCGKTQETKVDPTIPTAIAIKIKTAKVQINKSVSLTYTITPTSAQANDVAITLNNQLATAAKVGDNKTVKLTAGSSEGTVKVTITTTNGISASKTIKIQLDEVENYPDLSGYEIKLAQAEHALGYYDVKLTQETADKYSFYTGSDRDAKIQAWDEIEDNYNCTLNVVAYPSDAPWGPSRWQYILTQAQNEAAEYDFYVVPDGRIPSFVAGNAILDLTDWYNEYGKNLMAPMAITAGTYKGKLYSINAFDSEIYNMLGYNVGLYEELAKDDPTLKEPAQMYLDGEWNYDTFKDYCLKVQQLMITKYGQDAGYYCLSGYGSYYWVGMVNAAGVRILDTTSLTVSLTGVTETLAAQTLQDIYKAGAMDKAFQVDGSVATWNAGHSLFNTGDLWFVNAPDRWSKTLWGTEENTKYGYVPFPTTPESEITYIGATAEACIVMPTGREWAYEGYGADCTAENIYRAVLDYYNTAKNYYMNGEDYSKLSELTAKANQKFASQASVQAFLKMMLGTDDGTGNYVGGIDEYGFFEPMASNSNSVVGAYGASGTLGGDINVFIKGGDASAQWTDAIGGYVETVKQALVESYG